MRWLDGITVWMDMSLSKLQELVDGQGSLACCHPWGHKESDTTERLNNKKEELAEKAPSLPCAHTQERPYEDPGGKQSPASWEESPHQKLNQSKL